MLSGRSDMMSDGLGNVDTSKITNRSTLHLRPPMSYHVVVTTADSADYHSSPSLQ